MLRLMVVMTKDWLVPAAGNWLAAAGFHSVWRPRPPPVSVAAQNAWAPMMSDHSSRCRDFCTPPTQNMRGEHLHYEYFRRPHPPQKHLAMAMQDDPARPGSRRRRFFSMLTQ